MTPDALSEKNRRAYARRQFEGVSDQKVKARLTLNPTKAEYFRDASGRRHGRNSEWGAKCRRTFC